MCVDVWICVRKDVCGCVHVYECVGGELCVHVWICVSVWEESCVVCMCGACMSVWEVSCVYVHVSMWEERCAWCVLVCVEFRGQLWVLVLTSSRLLFEIGSLIGWNITT